MKSERFGSGESTGVRRTGDTTGTPGKETLVQQQLGYGHPPVLAEDEVANKEPGMLWQRRGGVSSGSETKKDRRPEPERRAEQSDNATNHAMNAKLKLLAYELDAAGKKLTFDLAVSNADKKADKAQIAETDARLMLTIHRLDDMARETAKQIDDLNTAKGEPRLAEGGQALLAALEEFQPVMNDVDAWMTAHKLDAPPREVVGRSNGIIKLIFPGVVPAGKSLTSVEKSAGFVTDTGINAHLDAAIAAAESVKSGNRYHADRVIMHAKELAGLLKDHPRFEGALEPRITKLIKLVDQILVDNPYLKRTFDEAIDPIRSVK